MQASWIVHIVAALLLAGPAAAAAGVVTVFGLPLGGKPSRPFQICKEVATPEALPCWVRRPYRSRDGVVGYITLPKNVTPAWAEYATVEIDLQADNTLSMVSVSAGANCDFAAMRTSLGARFGPPTTHQDRGRWQTFSWELPGAFVGLEKIEGTETCAANFRTQASVDRQLEYWRQRDAEKAARPKTP